MIISPIEITLKNNHKLILRSVRPDEAKIFLGHLAKTASESYKNLNRDADYWNKMPVEDEEKILTNFEKAERRFMLGAFDGNNIVGGLGLMGLDDGFGRFNAPLGISIQKAFSNTGLGTAMMRFAIEKAREAGVHRIELSVRTYNVEGIALYEKMGFRKIGRLTEVALIDGKFEDEWLYELILK